MEPVPFGVAPGRVNGFEGLTPLTFTMGTSAGTTSRSTVEHALNTTAPLAGAADLRLAFELRNPSDDAAGAFYQRAYVRLSFNGPTADLRRMAQLKVKMKSDVTRPVRIELGSSRYRTTTGRIPRFGWETTATEAGGTVTLDARMLGIAPGFTPAGDDLMMVLMAVNQIYVMAQPATRNPQTGLMPPGTSEKGWLQIDDVEIVVN
jgi:hypothetical protein